MARYGKFIGYKQPESTFAEKQDMSLLTGEIATRDTAWNWYGTRLGYLPNPSETLRAVGKDIAEYKYLLEDSHVNGCMSSRKAGTLSLKWAIDKAKSKSRQYEIIKERLNSWRIYDIMNEALNCVWFGYIPVEAVWEKEGELILPNRFVPKDPDWFRFSWDNETRFLSKWQMISGEPVPPYKIVWALYRPSYERPYGRPLASCCYWPIKFRHAGFKFWTTFCERFGMPWLKAEYPIGMQAFRIQQMIDMLSNTVQDGVVAYPSEFKVEAVKMNDTNSSTIHKEYINQMNEEISIAVLGQTLTTRMSSEGGAYAAAQVHGDIRQDIVIQDRIIVENIFNELIKWIYELNWPGQEMPVFHMVTSPEPTKEDGDLAVALKNAGAKFTKEYFINHFGLLETEFDLGSDSSSSAGPKPPFMFTT